MLKVLHGASPRDIPAMDTARLRDEFLIEDVFVPGEVRLTYTHVDRMIVGGGMRSLELSESWLPRLMDARLVLIPVQDGLTASDVRPLLGNRVGIFLGGSTEWKLATMREWGELAREVGCYYHVARVNTRRRIEMCSEAGATSFDGSSASRFAASLPRLERARCQPSLFGRAS